MVPVATAPVSRVSPFLLLKGQADLQNVWGNFHSSVYLFLVFFF
jgi:hypothetical protein